MAWQPIETAPKDGEAFIAALIVRNTKKGTSYWEMHIIWVDEETGEVHANCDAGWDRVNDYTHWMPLPTPPENAQ